MCSRTRRAADVGQQARQRPAQRDQFPIVAEASSAASATRRDRSSSPALHNAAARMTSDLTRVASRAERLRQVDGALGVLDGGRAVAARPSPVPRDTHASRTGSRAGTDSVRTPAARCSAAADAANRPTPECVGGQPDQRVGSRLEVGTGERRSPAVPAAGRVVPAELTQKRRMRAVRQRHHRADALQTRTRRRGRPGRWRSGPGRRRRRHAATTRSRRGRRGQRPASRVVPEGGVRPERSGSAASSNRDAINVAGETRYRRARHQTFAAEATLVNSLWSSMLIPCQPPTERHESWRTTQLGAISGNTRSFGSRGRFATTDLVARGSQR